MTKITKVEVNWWVGYGNSPELIVHVDVVPNHEDFFYSSHPDSPDKDFPTMLISVNMYPFIRFVKINDPTGNPTYHGALGGTYKLENGTDIKSRTGWSSRAGVINAKYREFVPNDIMDIVLYSPQYRSGWGGYAIDVEYIKTFLPKGVYLVREEKYGDITWYPSTSPNEVRKP